MSEELRATIIKILHEPQGRHFDPGVTMEENEKAWDNLVVDGIEQAFKDAGYIKLRPQEQAAPKSFVKYHSTVGNCMSGRDWYERFQDEYLKIKADNQTTAAILKAAKRAAGLKS